MHNDAMQILRNNIQKRVDRLCSHNSDTFLPKLSYFVDFLSTNRTTACIVTALLACNSNAQASLQDFISDECATSIECATEDEHAALSYLLLHRWSKDEENTRFSEMVSLFRESDQDELINHIKQQFLIPLSDYIDEQLDDTRLTLALLTRYKHRCEWFHRERLNALYHGDTKNGEANLARDLYEYLFDQGLQFHIEPKSADGIPDLIGDQTDDGRIVADAKIFDGDGRGKDYIIKGFNQVYTYTRNYNEPVGYMVIFRVCDTDLNFDVSGTGMSAPFVTHNGKTIFFINVDIHAYGTSASKRGKVRCVTIQESELITKVQSQQLSGDSDA